MDNPMYSGITGGIVEASDIMRDRGVSAEKAFRLQRHRAARRQQEYLDAIEEIESNVIQFRPRDK